MDLQTGLICLGCVCVSVIVIYLTTLISIREKSYDEAIAEVRKSNQTIVKGSKTDKQAKKEKKRNKKSKHDKLDSHQQTVDSDKDRSGELVTEKAIKTAANTVAAVVTDVVKKCIDKQETGGKHEHVGFKEPEVIEDEEENISRSRRSSLSTSSNGNAKPSKPILKNDAKCEVNLNRNGSPMKLQRSNSFEVIKPKDELELAKLGKRLKAKDKSSERVNGEVCLQNVQEVDVDAVDANNGITISNGTSSVVNSVFTNGNDHEIEVIAQSKKMSASTSGNKVKKSKSSQNKGKC